MRSLARFLLLLFVFAIPWEYSLDLEAPFGNIARMIGILLLLVAVSALLRTGRMRNSSPLHWMTLLLFLWFCFSYFWSMAPDATLVKLRGYFQEIMIVWLVWEFAENPSDLRNLFRAWLAGSWVLAILTIVNFISADVAATDQVRFAAFGQDPNDVARFLDLGFPIAALLFDTAEPLTGKVLSFGYFPLGFAAVLLTASRGGFLAALAAIVGCGVLLFQRYPKRIAGAAFLLPAAVVAIWSLTPRETLFRLGTIAEQFQSGDLNQRVNIWSAGWRAFLQSPIPGHGAGSFTIAAGLAPIDTAHNTVLAILVEGGLCALLLAVAIVVLSLRAIASMRGPLRIAMATLMIVWLLSSVVGTVGESRTTWLLFAIIALGRRFEDDQPQMLEDAFPFASSAQHFQAAERFE